MIYEINFVRTIICLLLLLFTSFSEVLSNKSSSKAMVPFAKRKLPLDTTFSGTHVSAMPFRLGFEFQETSGLCSWAKDQEKVQKKPLFLLHLEGDETPLWHVEIDGDDIEFVTPPFNPKQRDKLTIAIQTILASLKVLQREFNTKDRISFNEWVSAIKAMLHSHNINLVLKPIFDAISLEYLIKPNGSGHFNFFHEDEMSKAIVHYNPKPFWEPTFAPQATIQHPLEDTIPLYFSLLGAKTSFMVPFKISLPFLDWYRDSLYQKDKEAIYNISKMFGQKITGLIFLHALTLTQMEPHDENDGVLLHETLENWHMFGQMDAKLNLSLTVRRPFSQMLADIKGKDYEAIFLKAMKLNSLFYKEFNVLKSIARTNYAEQFFDDRHLPINLWKKLSLDKASLFKKKFYERNKGPLKALLSEGIISTTMIRNFNDNIKLNIRGIGISYNTLFLKLFPEACLTSIEFPKWRLVFNGKTLNFEVKPSLYDSLSPPWLLHRNNAMGRYKKETQDDLVYGEAIVEVRAISSVQPWFLDHVGLSRGVTGDFLRYPCPEMVDQALALFDFLSQFHSPENLYEIFFFLLPYEFSRDKL